MNPRRQWLAVSLTSLVLGTLGVAALTGINSAQAENLQPQQIAQVNQRPQGRFERGAGLAAAAEQLGVSEAELRTALGLPAAPVEPDFAGAAEFLEITEAELMDTLRATHRASGQRGPRPDFAAVAEQYGVSEEDLINALGIPAERPEPNIAAAAETLGISEEEMLNALQANRPGRGGWGCAGGPAGFERPGNGGGPGAGFNAQ
jgi:lambda repressor-like predicted transcriptional regulator